MLLLPSPCLTALVGNGSQIGLTAFAQNTNAFYACSPTTLASNLTEYRVVSWGIRLIAKDTAFNAKGKFYVALLPTSANAPSWNTLQTVTAASDAVISEYLVGFDITGGNGVSIMNHPSVRTFTAQDLQRGEIMVTGLPLTNSFYDFRGTQDRTSLNWSATTALGDEAVFTSTALTNATAVGRKDVSSLRGGMAVAIYATGLPASTNEFDIEIIYHLEGTPNLQSGTAFNVVPSAQQVLHGSTDTIEKALKFVQTAGKVVSFMADPVKATGNLVKEMGKLTVNRGTRTFMLE